MDLFDVRVHHLDGSVRVDLVGELDILAVPRLRECLSKLAYRYDADQVTIDCGALSFLDMSSLGVLISMCNRLDGGGRPCLANASPFVVRLLDLTNTLDRFALDAGVPVRAGV